ncbi:MAG: DUF2752 domain-containing protein [Phycisphaerae bacterium]|nr:DUF2752 domain-containing protein [Phycisphaerae bacterium]
MPMMRDALRSIFKIRLSDRAVAGLALAVVGLALLAIGSRDPRTHGLGVLCPSRRWLGIYCPGCGSTRATYDLLHGDIIAAWANNPATLLLGVPVALWLVASSVVTLVHGRRPRLTLPNRLGLWLAGALLLYTIARNIPHAAFDAWRPPVVHETSGS